MSLRSKSYKIYKKIYQKAIECEILKQILKDFEPTGDQFSRKMFIFAAGKRKNDKIMEARTTTATPGHLLVSISDMSMMKDIKKAISMLKGVTKVQKQKMKPRLYDPETGEYLNDETMKLIEDVHNGKEPVYHAESVDDMFQKILGYVPNKV